MNILVTGSTGFIASHLIEELLKNQNNNIIGIDNFYSGTLDNLNYIKSLDKHGKFTFIEADIRDFENLNNIVRQYDIKYIYHMAAIVSVQESINNPLLSGEVNVKGILNLLEASRLNNVKRIVFSSSAAVYGDEPTLPKNENSPLKPISPYGYEKLMGEQYMKLYNELYGIETISLRYFNVYGERQSATSDYSGVISIFENKFKSNVIPKIYGNGEQYRDFVYVKDVIRVNIQLMNTEDISTGVFCVGTSLKITINELMQHLNDKYSKNLEADYLSERKGDIKESVCDNQKLRDTIEDLQFTDFAEGLRKI